MNDRGIHSAVDLIDALTGAVIVADTFTCPVCGNQVRTDAIACRQCGSDAETGWAKDRAYEHVMPEEEHDRPRPRWWTKLAVLTMSVILLLAMLPHHRWVLYLLPALAILFIAWKVVKRGGASQSGLMAELIARCQHDRELAERLVETERGKLPNASEKELIGRALARLQRHRR